MCLTKVSLENQRGLAYTPVYYTHMSWFIKNDENQRLKPYFFGIKIAIYIKIVCNITLGTFTNVLRRKAKNENYKIFYTGLIFHIAF